MNGREIPDYRFKETEEIAMKFKKDKVLQNLTEKMTKKQFEHIKRKLEGKMLTNC